VGTRESVERSEMSWSEAGEEKLRLAQSREPFLPTATARPSHGADAVAAGEGRRTGGQLAHMRWWRWRGSRNFGSKDPALKPHDGSFQSWQRKVKTDSTAGSGPERTKIRSKTSRGEQPTTAEGKWASPLNPPARSCLPSPSEGRDAGVVLGISCVS